MPMLGPWITKRKIMYLYSRLKVKHKLYSIIHYENIEKKHTKRIDELKKKNIDGNCVYFYWKGE